MPALLVDMGEVLCLLEREKLMRALQLFSRDPIRQGADPMEIYREYLDSGLNDRFDSGMATLYFYREICRFFDIDPVSLSYGEFRRIWGAVIAKLNEPLIALLREIRKRTRTKMVFASNTQELHWEYFVKHHGHVLDLFDTFALSHAIGVSKPDPQFWTECALRLGVEVPALLLLDDKPENGASLMRAGGSFLLYNATRHGEIECKLRKLCQL